MASKFVRFLGSVRLAVPLLAAIAAILIWATFYESAVGSATVQREIYKSAWFGALMFLLAINLGISTLSRYPWKGPRKIGFALTHWGLIVIIAGAAAVIHLSTEGMLLVRTDGTPNDRIRVEGDLLEVVSPEQIHQQTDIFVKPDGSVFPKKLAGLSWLNYSDQTIKTVRFTDTGTVDNLAVKLQLHSDRMGQTLERWLAVAPATYRQIDIGPAHLEISQAKDDAELKQLLSPPADGAAAYGTIEIGDRTFDIQQSLGQALQINQDLTAEIVQIWPDFRLDANRQPTSASTQFRNPAVQVNLTQGEVQEHWFVFANPEFEPVRSGNAIALPIAYIAPQPKAADYFRIVASADRSLYYAALSSKGFKSGEFHAGEAVSPGWADFQISLVQQLSHAQIQREIVPVTPVAGGTFANEGSPALQVAAADGQEFWLPWGEPTTFDTPAGSYFAAFSPKMLQLPFYVKLDDFIVERNEGSESVAMWTSRVTLFDPKTDTIARRSVWMNHPTWFRGWKLAQASWNPGDLQQSTLQLKREPWWVTALTWMGSLMVVSGIGVMFYGPAIAKRFRLLAKPIVQPTVQVEGPTDETLASSELLVNETAPESVPELATIGK